MRIADRFPGAAIPQQHRSSAVLPLRNDALELAVLERMILDVHRQALVGRIQAGALRDRPALQDAFELEPEVVVQTRRRMLLDQVRALLIARGRRHLAGGLRCLLEVTLTSIFAKPHGFIFPRPSATVHSRAACGHVPCYLTRL